MNRLIIQIYVEFHLSMLFMIMSTAGFNNCWIQQHATSSHHLQMRGCGQNLILTNFWTIFYYQFSVK